MEENIKKNEELEQELEELDKIEDISKEVEEVEEVEEAEEDDENEENPLEALQDDIKQLEEDLLRAKSDTENARRRAKIDVEEATKFSVSGFAKELIGMIENLQLALNNIPAEARNEDAVLKSFAEGIEMTMQSTLTVFERYGIKRINPKSGETFDHNYHQAIMQIETEEYQAGKIVEVYQAGYTIFKKQRLFDLGIARYAPTTLVKSFVFQDIIKNNS